MNADHEPWEGIPCGLPDWIYTADLDLFEIRWAIKRRNASYFADVVGIDTIESEGAEILKMIRTAQDIENAAQKVRHELVIEARSRGIYLREIGDTLHVRPSAVSNIVDREKLTPERKVEIKRELHAWAVLAHLWGRDIETDEPGESFYRHGVYHLLLAQQRFDRALKIHSRGGDPSVLLQSSYETLRNAFLSLTDPIIPRTIAKYVPRSSIDADSAWVTMPDAATASTRHGIFKVVLAQSTFAESLKEGGPADVILAGTYMAGALVSLSRPEAQFISDEMIEFLRRAHPDLLPATHLDPDQIFRLHERQSGAHGPDDLDEE